MQGYGYPDMPDRNQDPGWIYAVRVAPDMIKIGWSTNPGLRAYQHPGAIVGCRPAVRGQEGEIHRLMAKCRVPSGGDPLGGRETYYETQRVARLLKTLGPVPARREDKNIRLQTDVWIALKLKAIEKGRTVTDLVDEILRRVLLRKAA